jgi:hypothetical protein
MLMVGGEYESGSCVMVAEGICFNVGDTCSNGVDWAGEQTNSLGM